MGAGKWGLKCESRGVTAVDCERTPWKDRRKDPCNWGCLKRKPRTPQKQGVIIGWCTSWGARQAPLCCLPHPLSSESVGHGRGTLLSRIAHTANQGLLTSLGSRVLSPAHAKTSFRVSSGCPCLRWETPCSGRDQVVKCGGGDCLWGDDNCWLCEYCRGKGDEGLCGQDAPRGGAVCCLVAWKGLPPRPARPSRLQLPASLCHHRYFSHTPTVAIAPLPG